MKTIATIQKPVLDRITTEDAIALVKSSFEDELSKALSLKKVSAPMVVLGGTGINDDLNGTERAVKFPIKDMDETKAEVVHSLAKWKRLRLKEYEVEVEKGILTDMRALRPDEDLTPLHSIFVDQWDWEIRIDEQQRQLNFLKQKVEAIYGSILQVEQKTFEAYPDLLPSLPKEIKFVHTEELLEMFPDKTPKEREDEIAKLYGAVFIIGIGGTLAHGMKHDGRAPDYDDWSTPTAGGFKGLNGDIVVWNPVLGRAFELSSMGIRVDKKALLKQLEIEGAEDRKELYFHKRVLDETLPLSMGGGIGQSRICMLLLKKRHIGEVQVAIWPEETRQFYLEQGVELL